MRQAILTSCLFMLMTACNVHLHPYKDYLDQSVGHATHNAVAEKMGGPNHTVKLDGGGDVWTYEYCCHRRRRPACDGPCSTELQLSKHHLGL